MAVNNRNDGGSVRCGSVPGPSAALHTEWHVLGKQLSCVPWRLFLTHLKIMIQHSGQKGDRGSCRQQCIPVLVRSRGRRARRPRRPRRSTLVRLCVRSRSADPIPRSMQCLRREADASNGPRPARGASMLAPCGRERGRSLMDRLILLQVPVWLTLSHIQLQIQIHIHMPSALVARSKAPTRRQSNTSVLHIELSDCSRLVGVLRVGVSICNMHQWVVLGCTGSRSSLADPEQLAPLASAAT